MNISDFVNGPSHLMKTWKSLRTKLTTDLTDYQQLENVLNFWSNAPISTITSDWNDAESWIEPWTFIHNNKFDESSRAVGMFFSLLLSHDGRWTTDRLSLVCITNQTITTPRIILEIDNRLILNLEYRAVVDHCTSSPNYTIHTRYDYQTARYSML